MNPCIIIPNYIATDELRQLSINTIESMRKTSNVFIVSVDDGSPMDTTFLDEISDHTIHIKNNSGFAKASNAGLRWALSQNFDYIGCANNDIEVFDGWIEELIYPFEKWDNCGITGLISSKERVIDSKPIELYKVPKITSGGLLNHWMQSGGLWMSASNILKEIGLFDEQFITGGEEDVDLFLRCERDFGYQIIMSGYSCFWHKEGATRWNNEVEPGFKEKNKAIESNNYDKFAEKWGWDIRKDGLRFYEDVIEIK